LTLTSCDEAERGDVENYGVCGVLALVIWSIATSIARYRAVATRDLLAKEAGT
jgi:hypothetical protein